MPMIGSPLAASRREPARAVRLPEAVKRVILSMIEGGIDFISAAKQHGVQPQTMRRWLGRAECISYLRKRRAQFRATICAQNEAVLAQIRDTSDGNQMARVAAIKTLEQLEDTATSKPSNAPTPGVTIKIIHQAPQPAPIDVTPPPAPRIIDAGEQ
jgi:hypothetical protein